MCSLENTRKIKISASQLMSNMICMNYDHNKKFYSGYKNFHFNSPKGYSLKIINAQTASYICSLISYLTCAGKSKRICIRLCPGKDVELVHGHKFCLDINNENICWQKNSGRHVF